MTVGKSTGWSGIQKKVPKIETLPIHDIFDSKI